MDLRKHYSTVVLSDIHVGSEYFKIKEATRFLKHVNCKQLILNGDIIDGWQLHMPFTFSNISIVPDTTLAEDEQGSWSVVTYTEEAFSEEQTGLYFSEAI